MKKTITLVVVLISIFALSSCSSISSSVASGNADSRTDAALSFVESNDGIHLAVQTKIDEEDIDMDIQIVENDMVVSTVIDGETRTIIQDESFTYVLSDDIKFGYKLNNDDDDELIQTLNSFKNFTNISSAMIDSGSMNIEGSSYNYEMFSITTLADTSIKYCYNNNDDLSYIIFSRQDEDKIIKINNIDFNISVESFEVPKDYNISEE
ncbi:MAG: hypothetical protein JJE03_06175 [Peptostreptococcaceae bacterium]|nr:hypothetical protein [Peptostreptococcaceae bacterium]